MSNYRLPTYFEVNEERFNIRDKGDYRIVLSCFNILSNVVGDEIEALYTCLIVFYEEFNDLDDIIAKRDCLKELIQKMFWFFDCGQDYSTSSANKPKLIDWDKDEMLLISAINNVAGKEVRAEENLHWWTFIGYYMAIGECSLSQVVSIRNKIATGKKLEKYEKEFKANNPQYFDFDYRTQQDKEADEWIQTLWNNGGEN